jgi:hypothetical protein
MQSNDANGYSMQAMRWNRIVPTALALLASALAAGLWYRGMHPHGDALENAMPPAASVAAPAPTGSTGPGWLPGGPPLLGADIAAQTLAQQLERLSVSREPRDAYQAYRLVRACMDLQRPPAQASLTVDADSALARVPDPAAFCAGMTERMRMDRIVLLEQAARAGVDGAVEALVEEGPFGDPNALATRPDDPLVTEWKARIGRMLGEQAGQGDWASLYLLFTGYAFGNPAIDVDRQNALAYGLALRDIVVRLDGLTEDEAIPFNGPFLDQVRAGLNPEQQSRAALQAAAIVDAARRKRVQAPSPER